MDRYWRQRGASLTVATAIRSIACERGALSILPACTKKRERIRHEVQTPQFVFVTALGRSETLVHSSIGMTAQPQGAAARLFTV